MKVNFQRRKAKVETRHDRVLACRSIKPPAQGTLHPDNQSDGSMAGVYEPRFGQGWYLHQEIKINCLGMMKNIIHSDF